MERYQTTPSFHVESTPIEALPLEALRGLWARVSLMGHTTAYGQVSVVNVGAPDAPVSMFKIVQPELAAEGPRLTCESGQWFAYKGYPERPEQTHYYGRQAIFEIEPLSQGACVAFYRERDGKLLRPGRRGYSCLWEGYTEALGKAGLLVEGPWTSAHQAIIDAVDAEADQYAPKPYLHDMDDVSDPLADVEDEG